MAGKSSQLQIRVTPEQKRALKRLARQAELDVSSWVLGRLLPGEGRKFQEHAARLADAGGRRYALAELADFLQALPAEAFRRAIAHPPETQLDAATLNYLAGTLELAAHRRRQEPPTWTAAVRVPAEPAFGSSLGGVRLHLLVSAPVALRRRNLFMDASIDDRV